LAQHLRERLRHPVRRDGAEMLPVINCQTAAGSFTQSMRLFEHRVEHRREIAWRRVDNLQDFRHRGFLSLAFVALGSALVELPPEFRVGAPKIGYRVVDRRGHWLFPSGRGPNTIGR